VQSDRQAPTLRSLEEAVKRYPYMVVEGLASVIGLEEDNFINF
jgi:hypothetical protein